MGQAISLFYTTFFDFTERTASDPTAATLIFIAALLTGLGVYDHLAQWAGAGTAVPVTGLSNAIASAAIEHRSEGFILGVGGNMFKLAGPVIVYGVLAAFFRWSYSLHMISFRGWRALKGHRTWIPPTCLSFCRHCGWSF